MINFSRLFNSVVHYAHVCKMKIHHIKVVFYTKIAERKFRRISYRTCCCGLSMDNHPITEEHQPRDMKKYIINKYVSAKLGGNDFMEWAIIKYMQSKMRQLSND